MSDAKFEQFWTVVGQSQYELPDELKPILRDAMEKAGLFAAGGAGATVTKTKKLSGYNLFMREKMAELKEEGVPSNERMGKVSKMWKEVGDDEKEEWKEKAAALSPTVTTTATKTKKAKKEGPKKLSGYQLFVRETMPEVKADESIEPKGRMGEIGKRWKALSEADQGQWKEKAEEVNAEAQAEWDAAH
jgi:hypothetical protein